MENWIEELRNLKEEDLSSVMFSYQLLVLKKEPFFSCPKEKIMNKKKIREKKLPWESSWPLVSFLGIPSSAKTASSSASSFFFNSFFESCLSVSLETNGWGRSLGTGSVDTGTLSSWSYSSSISSPPSSRRSSSLSLCCAVQANIYSIPWIILSNSLQAAVHPILEGHKPNA